MTAKFGPFAIDTVATQFHRQVAASGTAGAVIPLIVASVAPAAQISAFVAGTTLAGLMALGGLGASAGGAGIVKEFIRVTFRGAFAMTATASVGMFFGVAA